MDTWPMRPRANYSTEEADRFRKALELVATTNNPPEGYYFGLAVQSYLLGDNLSAIDLIYDHLDDSGPDDAQAHLLLGKIHTELEEIQQAEESFKQVLKLEPNNVEAQFRLAWLKLHRGLNHDNDLAVATSLLDGLEQETKKSRNSIFSAEHERVFLDLRCELLSRTSTTSTVSSMKLQSIIQNYPRHIGLHLLLLDTFKISGDYASALTHIERNARVMRHEKQWWEAGLLLCNTSLGQSDPIFSSAVNTQLPLPDIYRVKLLCCDSLLGLVSRRSPQQVSNQSVEMLLQTYADTLKLSSALESKDDTFLAVLKDHRSHLQVRVAEVLMRRKNWQQARQVIQTADNVKLDIEVGTHTLEAVKQLEFKSRLARAKYDLAVLEASMSSAVDNSDVALEECLSIDFELIRECGIVASDLNAVVETLVWYLNRGLINGVTTLTGAIFGELPAIVTGEESSVFSELALELEFFLLKHAVKNALPSAVEQLISRLRNESVDLHPLALFDAESYHSIADADSNDVKLWQHALLYLQLATNAALDDVEKTLKEATPQVRWAMAGKAALLSQRVANAVGSPTNKPSSGGVLLASPVKKPPRAYLPESVNLARRRMNFFAVEGSTMKTDAVAGPPQKLDGRGIVIQSLKTKRECLLADQVLIAATQLMQSRAQGYRQMLQSAHAKSSAVNYARHWAQNYIDFFGDILKQINVIAQEVVEGDDMDRILSRSSPAFVTYGQFWESLRRYLVSKEPTPTEEAQMEHEEDSVFSLLLDAATPDTLLLLGQLLHARFELWHKKNPNAPLPAGKVSQAIECLEKLLRAPALSTEQEKRRSRLVADLGLFGIAASRRRSISGRSASPRGANRAQSPRRSGSASSAPNESGDEISADEAGDEDNYAEDEDFESNDDSFDEDKYESDEASDDELVAKQAINPAKRSLFNTIQRRTSPSPMSQRRTSPSPSPSRRSNLSSSPGPGSRTSTSGSAAPVPLPQLPIDNVPTRQSRLSELSKLRAQTQLVMQAKSKAPQVAVATNPPPTEAGQPTLPTKAAQPETSAASSALPRVPAETSASTKAPTFDAPAPKQASTAFATPFGPPPVAKPVPPTQPVTAESSLSSKTSSLDNAAQKQAPTSFATPFGSNAVATPSAASPLAMPFGTTSSLAPASNDPIKTPQTNPASVAAPVAAPLETKPAAAPASTLATPFGSASFAFGSSPFGAPIKGATGSLVVPTIAPSGDKTAEAVSPIKLDSRPTSFLSDSSSTAPTTEQPKPTWQPRDVFGFAAAPSEAKQPIATAGSGLADRDSKPAASGIGFGAAPAAAVKDQKPATAGFGFGAAAVSAPDTKKEEKPVSGFGFGAAPVADAKKEEKPGLSGFGFGSTDAKKEEKPATSGFGFGAAAASGAKQEEKPPTGFGSTAFVSTEAKADEKPSVPGFGFGVPAANDPKKEEKPAVTGFGVPAAKDEKPTTAGFGFGSIKKDEKPATAGFGFGAAPAGDAKKDEKPVAAGFGAPVADAKKDEKPATVGFGFGATEIKKDEKWFRCS
eukprot:TRINITY_DN1000_c0_g1_i8.p1 TRINITY_DN1000_c0_g1~~TRINITY_DN1000_c0_g1_i8.p1  ORF type:complete len:1528 (+),score=412.04 TRINITY_DN1000_c0_g1_i8:66-4649(+)